MSEEHPEYHSFLLRLWAVRLNEGLNWRVSIEDPKTKIILGFDSVQKLSEHLERLTKIPDKKDSL